MCWGNGVDVADGHGDQMKNLFVIRTSAAFVIGSMIVSAIYSWYAMANNVQFHKGVILVVPSEAVTLMLFVASLLSALCSVFYLLGLALSKALPRIQSALAIGLASLLLAVLVWIATREDVLFFLAYFGIAFVGGLALRPTKQDLQQAPSRW